MADKKKQAPVAKKKDKADSMNSAKQKSESLDARIKELEQKIEHSKVEAKKFEDNFLRAVAESENIKKRSEKDLDAAHKYAVSGFAKDLLDVLENLYRSTDHVTEEQKSEPAVSQILEGVELTRNEFVRVFKKYGIERISPKIGEKFDHNYHQAISQQKDANHASNTILQVTQAGYILQGRLIRPALVIVNS
ncbi:MAG: nucleotide exchange factor GrpE [Alphaproteobacteria bacterium]|nr:nucleotide exchange factor GrpE [Alphaproteobacteria bacterium]